MIHKYIIGNGIGDYASIMALFITIVGFVLTFIKVLQSKKIAEQSKEIAEKIRTDIMRTDTVIEFSNAISTMDEIKRLHRKNAWEILPERYSVLRKTLISIKTSSKDLSDNQIKILQSAIQNFKNIEEQVEIALLQNKIPDNIDKLNKIISLQSDKLQETLIEIKNKIGIE